MMKYNFMILAIVLAIIFLLGIICNMFYMYYLKKSRLNDIENDLTKNNRILSIISADVPLVAFRSMCPVELPNTDDDITDALKYVDTAKFASELLENLYEQTGI